MFFFQVKGIGKADTLKTALNRSVYYGHLILVSFQIKYMNEVERLAFMMMMMVMIVLMMIVLMMIVLMMIVMMVLVIMILIMIVMILIMIVTIAIMIVMMVL